MKIKKNREHKYIKIATVLEKQIRSGTLKTGDRLPSLRNICAAYGVSQNTALNAYLHLESKMLIQSRPQSGYYVSYFLQRMPAIASTSQPSFKAYYGTSELLVRQVYDQLDETEALPLALGTPAPELLPIAKLNKGIVEATRRLKHSGVTYEKTEGNKHLRSQIAHRAYTMKAAIRPDDIITTNGCLNAISYCLMAVTQKNDTIALESPVSFGMLQVAQSLGHKVLELPTSADKGVDLNALEDAMSGKNIKACLLIPNFSNPLGSCMPDDHKKNAVMLAEKYNVPIIENDLNGDVYFGTARPMSCKSFDESGITLWCGSVSKTLSPGYRVGWVAAGKYQEAVRRLKLYHSISSAPLTQEVVAGFLETGRYDHHLKLLRRALESNLAKYTDAIIRYFPEGTRISRPRGGFVLWVELPELVDTMRLLEVASLKKIRFAPGRIFSLQNQYNNCLRLNYGLTWTPQLERNLKVLGDLACRIKVS